VEETLNRSLQRKEITMKSYYAIWGGIVVLAGAIMVSAGTVARAIGDTAASGKNTSFFGVVLILIGLLGPTLIAFLKRAYDEAPVDDKRKEP
jgi:uncharacterized membrane protein